MQASELRWRRPVSPWVYSIALYNNWNGNWQQLAFQNLELARESLAKNMNFQPEPPGALFPVVRQLNKGRVILASGSPRRKELLLRLGVDFEVIPSTFAEDLDKSEYPSPRDYVLETAHHKALDLITGSSPILHTSTTGCTTIIASDTIIVHESAILEKPNSTPHAFDMLRKLSGKTHQVLTAVVVVVIDSTGRKVYKDVAETDVEFGCLSDEIIQTYVASGEPMDKAGGYGYQGLAAALIPRINGCYYNVVGFPCYLFLQLLQKHFKSSET
ncbi:Maf-like protein-domain-containing protein [Phlyctochytrium arcticum]|nr:Maf-like protein-domain-containing protein [Phlyctochytrium arcticum]